MATKTVLYKAGTGIALEACDLFAPFERLQGDNLGLEIIDPYRLYGTFRSTTRTTAGTTTITSPEDNGSLVITDLLISGEKQAGSTAEVRFTDDTNTSTLFLASQVDAPPNFSHSFAGRIQGWRDARVDLITSGAGDATVLLCYIKVPNGLPYAEWDTYR